MNTVEIEQAVSDLVDDPFDRENFPFAFLEAFGNKATTIKRRHVSSKIRTAAIKVISVAAFYSVVISI